MKKTAKKDLELDDWLNYLHIMDNVGKNLKLLVAFFTIYPLAFAIWFD